MDNDSFAKPRKQLAEQEACPGSIPAPVSQGVRQVPSLHQIEETLAKLWTLSEEQARNSSDNTGSTKLSTLLERTCEEAQALHRRHVALKRQGYTQNYFPLTYKLLEDEWVSLVERYWRLCDTSDRDVAIALNEFPRFLRYQNPSIMEKYPFAAELAEFELTQKQVMNIDVSIMTGHVSKEEIQEIQNDHYPILNPTAVVASYEYPISAIVHKLQQRHKAKVLGFRKSPSNFAIYQDPTTHELKTQELGAVAAKILLDARLKPTAISELIQNALLRLNDPNNADMQNLVLAAIVRFNEAGLLLGYAPL